MTDPTASQPAASARLDSGLRRPSDVRRPALLFCALIALVALCSVAGRAAPAVRAQANESHLQTVRVEYGILLDLYVRPLDPTELLGVAWSGATGYLRRKGITVSTPPPRVQGDRDQAFATFGASWAALGVEVTGRFDMTLVAFAADDAMANSLNDDHTGFLAPDIYQAEQQDLGGADSTKIGLGVDSNTEPPHVVFELAPGGPAEQAGIRPGDSIVAINGQSVEFLADGAYEDALSGPAGSVVTVTFRRPGSRATIDITVVLGPFRFPIFSSAILPEGVGYIRLRSFVNPWIALDNNQNVLQELDAALKSFESAGVTEWILDLRDNLGGAGLTNQAFAGRFLADGRTDIDTDDRGHRAEYLVDGHVFPVQRPLAVLIDGGSASSSEVVASTLHEYGRATLVGTRSAGGLGSADIFPLADGAGLEVTVARVVSGRYGTQIDNVGVAADVQAGPPTLSDLAAGRDPVIEAAEAALAGQQSFTPPAVTDATLSEADVRTALSAYEVSTAEVPQAPEIQTVNSFGDFVINRYNEWNNWEGGGRDGFASRDLAHQRGWQGALLQFFGQDPEGPGMVVEADLYTNADGAAAAMAGKDFPDLLVPVASPLQLGDQSIGFKGQWADTGLREIVWRHGRLLFTVAFNTVPGEETFDPLIILARAVEAHYRANPLN